MSAILGQYEFDRWEGPAPPLVQSTVEVIYRPGQAVAAAKILPLQSQPGEFRGTAYVPWIHATSLSTQYRFTIGNVVTLSYAGSVYGANYLVQDVRIEEVRQLVRATGRHPSGQQFDHAPAGRIISRWMLVALS
jgi:hypothetical protein